MKDKSPILSETIAIQRERLGLSLQHVADLAGITKSHMWDLEQGRSQNPTIATIDGLARALHIPFTKLAASARNSLMER